MRLSTRVLIFDIMALILVSLSILALRENQKAEETIVWLMFAFCWSSILRMRLIKETEKQCDK